MIKTSAMFSAHAIHVLIRNTLIILVVLFLALFIWLSFGIKFDTLKYDRYNVEGLYIKLDKKLTLQADKITIPKRKASPAVHRVDEALENIKYILTFFDDIQLNEIHFDNNVLGLYFRDNILQISSKDYLIRGNVQRKGNMLIGSIPILQLKQHDVTIRGEFSYNFHEDILTTQGKFLYKNVSGKFWANKADENIDFRLHSDEFTDLKSIIDNFELKPVVRAWIVDKVQAKSYKLLSLEGHGDVVDKEFTLDLASLKGEVLFNDVSIFFKEGLDPVLAPEFILSYSDQGGLYFDLDDPRYKGKDLDGSSVSIVNLRDENTTLKLNLKFDTVFDSYVRTILKAYDIKVPVNQKSGKVKATLDMDIGLKQDFIDVKSDVNFTKGIVEIDKVQLSVDEGALKYRDGMITFKDVMLNHSLYGGLLNGNLNIEKKSSDFIFEAKKVLLETEDEVLFSMKDETIPFTLDYSNSIDINIPKYSTTFTNDKNVSVLKVTDLNRVKPYVGKSLDIEDGGTLEVTTKDFETYSLKGVLHRTSCFIYENNNACTVRIPFLARASSDDFDFYALNNRLHFNKKKSRIIIKDLNIDLQKFLTHAKEKQKASKKNAKQKKYVIIGKNSHLRYDEYSLLTDSYDVEIAPNGEIKAIGSTGGDIVKFSRKDDNLTLQALRIKDKVLHPLINFDGLQKGRYSLTKSGQPDKVMNGEIIVEGGVMRDFKAYNNTLAFINTIPALATLQKPGYSTEGFTITSGVVEYRMINKKKIIFDSIYIKGDASTLIGKGELDLEKKTISIDLAIQVAKALGNAVGSIPLVGYILVGEDKSLTVSLEIRGSLDKPSVNVSAAKDILSYPLEVIKRTFEAPGKMLSTEKTK